MCDCDPFAYAQLLDRIMPLARGERYEEPLDEALAQRGFGEVVGGGTMQQKSGEIEYVGIDLNLRHLQESIPFVCSFLEERGAAKGSALMVSVGEAKRTIPFGVAVGIGVYLDGVNLPPEVYRECDINVVWEEFSRRLEGEGEIRGHWHGPTETALYIYGKSKSRMRVLLSDYTRRYRLCHGARVVDITPP